MKRRTFMGLLGGAAVAPHVARAQQRMPVIGFLNPAFPDTYAFNADAFREGLAQAGFVEGRNVRIEYRWGKGDYSVLPQLAQELVALNVSVIAATGDIFSARSALGATRTIPIVFTLGADPVRHGLVASQNRPGGNATGVNLFSSILSAKRVQFLSEIAPRARRIALFMNPSNVSAVAEQTEAQEGARAIGREAFVLNIRTPGDLDAAFAEAVRLECDSYITATDPLILDRRAQIVGFGEQHHLPGVGFVRQFSLAGTLISYGPSITWMYRQAGIYVGEVLKGAKVGELPVLQPTEFETVINLKTAKALDIEVSQMLLAQATEVIE